MPKKKEEEAPTRTEILRGLTRGLSRSDEVVFTPADKLFNVHEIRLDSGIFSLNLALNGGYPCGQNVIIYGEPNVGKDLTANLCLAALQRNKGKEATAAFINNEGEFDKNFARLVGCKLDWSDGEIDLWEERHKKKLPAKKKKELKNEGIGDIWFPHAKDAQAAMDLILDLSSAGVFDMIVLNSIDGLILAEAMAGAQKDGISGASKGRGGQGRAQLLSDFFRLKGHIMQEPVKVKRRGRSVEEKRRTVCFFISQLRMAQIGPNITLDKQQTGGWALKHYSGVTLQMSRVSGKETYTGPQSKKAPDHVETSHLINYYLKKVKYGAADGKNVQVRYYKHDHVGKESTIPAGTLDEAEAIRTALLDTDWLVQHGSRGYYLRLPGHEERFIAGGRMLVDEVLRDEEEVRWACQKLLTERVSGTEVEENLPKVPGVGEDGSGEVRKDDKG